MLAILYDFNYDERVEPGGCGRLVASPRPRTSRHRAPRDASKVIDWDESSLSAGIGPPGLHLGNNKDRPVDINQQVGVPAIIFWCNAKSTSANCKTQWQEH